MKILYVRETPLTIVFKMNTQLEIVIIFAEEKNRNEIGGHGQKGKMGASTVSVFFCFIKKVLTQI